MKKMEIREIQAVTLEILRNIDKFCRERGIRYFLDSGTLLGAARHGGFIPWDDDADLVMPRPDYERFISEYVDSDEYRLYSPSRQNCFLPYSRLCEMKRTYFKQVSIWTREEPGVGIDIIPLDGAPDSVEEYDKLSEKIVKLRNRVWGLRSIISKRAGFHFRRTLWGFAKDCVHFLVRKIRELNPEFFIRRNLLKFRQLRLKYPYDISNNCFYIVVNYGRRKYWRKEWFADVAYLDFCGEKYPVPIGWEMRLRTEYGDWKTPPPESERVGHESCQTMWWRD